MTELIIDKMEKDQEFYLEHLKGFHTWFLWQKVPQAFGKDWEQIKTGDLETCMKEMRRRQNGSLS